MSQTTTEPGNQLSEVLSRINALTQQSHARPTPHENSIPRLTESYGGHLPLQFIDAGSMHLPTLEDVVDEDEPRGRSLERLASDSRSGGSETQVQGKLTAARQEQLLSEMEPLIKAAVKKAILSELVVIEKALKTTLEQDVMDALKQRIESGQF